MFWSAVISVLAVVLTSAHLYDRLHRGLPGVVRHVSIGAGSSVNAAYLASMASGRKWADFNDRRAGDPLAHDTAFAPPRGRSGPSLRVPRPTRPRLTQGLLVPQRVPGLASAAAWAA